MDQYWQLTTPGKGTVDLRNYDEGLVTSMGAILKNYGTPPIMTYVLETGSGGCGGDVPVYFSSADPTIVKETIPRVFITRSSEDEVLQRLHPGDIEWRDRFDNSPEIGTTGNYQEVEESVQAWPYDFSYDLDIRGATRLQAQAIWSWIQKNTTIKPQGYINVKDSAGDVRGYDIQYDSISQADEVDDIHMRYPGLAVTIRVLGEVNIYPVGGSDSRKKVIQQTDQNFSRK